MPAHPLILFGAFDRHNFGDLLLGETARSLFADVPVVCAGLAERDMTPYGGQRVRSIVALAHEWGDAPAEILHVGGETLSCSLYEAAVMLQNETDARAAIARYDRNSAAAQAWAAQIVGLDQPLAYLVPRSLFKNARWIGHLGIGGADWARLPTAMREQAIRELRQADFVWVRDGTTHEALARAGIDALLAPDPAVLVRRLFQTRIEKRAGQGPLRAVLERFPAGYLAIQFSADFGDDATLDILGRQLAEIHAATGYGIVLFRAGTAPWHDDLKVYRRLPVRVDPPTVVLFESPHLWDICALLAASRGYAGSSLHGRLVSEAFGHPAVSLMRSPNAAPKLSAHIKTWHDAVNAGLAVPETLAGQLLSVLRKGGGAAREEALIARCLAAVAGARPPSSRRANQRKTTADEGGNGRAGGRFGSGRRQP